MLLHTLSIDPHYYEAYNNYLMLLIKKERDSDADLLLDLAMRKNPNDAKFYHLYGRFLCTRK